MLAKRLSLSLLAIATISLIVSAATFALFTASTTNANNTFTTGTVSLTDPVPIHQEFSNIAPGDKDQPMKDTTLTYTGSLDGWVGFYGTLSGELMTCNPDEFYVVVEKTTFNNTMHEIKDTDAVVIGSAAFKKGDIVTIHGAYSLGLAANNDCQGKKAELNLWVQAVQARNNTNAAGTGPVSWK